MKKFILFIFVVLIPIVALSLPKKDVFDMQDVNSYTLVVSAAQAEERGLSYLQNGSDAIIKVSSKEDAQKIYEDLNAKCVIFALDGKCADQTKKFLKIEQFYVQNVDGYEILYGYTPLYPSYKMVENKRVNVQIVCKEGQTLCGFPMIETGF